MDYDKRRNEMLTQKCDVDHAEFIKSIVENKHEGYKFVVTAWDKLCGIIYADYTTKTFEYENFTEDFLYKPFGNNENPGWDDLQLLLESRCVPKTRRDIDDILDFLGLKEYNPLEILKITKGELLSDKKKMEVIRLE